MKLANVTEASAWLMVKFPHLTSFMTAIIFRPGQGGREQRVAGQEARGIGAREAAGRRKRQQSAQQPLYIIKSMHAAVKSEARDPPKQQVGAQWGCWCCGPEITMRAVKVHRNWRV